MPTNRKSYCTLGESLADMHRNKGQEGMFVHAQSRRDVYLLILFVWHDLEENFQKTKGPLMYYYCTSKAVGLLRYDIQFSLRLSAGIKRHKAAFRLSTGSALSERQPRGHLIYFGKGQQDVGRRLFLAVRSDRELMLSGAKILYLAFLPSLLIYCTSPSLDIEHWAELG